MKKDIYKDWRNEEINERGIKLNSEEDWHGGREKELERSNENKGRVNSYENCQRSREQSKRDRNERVNLCVRSSRPEKIFYTIHFFAS